MNSSGSTLCNHGRFPLMHVCKKECTEQRYCAKVESYEGARREQRGGSFAEEQEVVGPHLLQVLGPDFKGPTCSETLKCPVFRVSSGLKSKIPQASSRVPFVRRVCAMPDAVRNIKKTFSTPSMTFFFFYYFLVCLSSLFFVLVSRFIFSLPFIPGAANITVKINLLKKVARLFISISRIAQIRSYTFAQITF